MDFPKILKRLRTQQGMTQEELGAKVNVTKVSISGYENGNRTPDIDTLQKLANFFKVTVDELLGRGDVYDIGWAIREEREEQGISVRELAAELGVNETTISQFEEDEAPVSQVLIEKIAEIFGMSYPAFLDKYNMYEGSIHPHFGGDADKQVAFDKAVEEDVKKEHAQRIQTIAAHHDDEEWTEKELEEIEKFKEFVRMKREKKE